MLPPWGAHALILRMHESLAGLYETYVMPTYGRFDLDLVSGTGARVTDATGKQYLDFGAGIAVCSLGHCHPDVTAAISDQAARLVHTSNLYRTEPQAHLARELVRIVGEGKVFFCNSGAEANEGLMKLARRYGSGERRFRIVTFAGSFHGRTLAGVSATGQEKVKVGFHPLLDGFDHAEFNDLYSVERALTPETAAILLEPIQGEGGIHVATPEFLRGLRRICDKHHLLLLFDEVQCGLGRTGNLCGWRSIAPDVQPDGVSWAKGVANGFPLGAFWASAATFSPEGTPLCNLLGPGSHGTTYGGNPISCAAALKVLELVRQAGFLDRVPALGRRLVDALAPISPCRGLGLMIGMPLPPEIPALEAVVKLQAAGLLVVPAGPDVIRFLPPLNVSDQEVDEAAAIVNDTLS